MRVLTQMSQVARHAAGDDAPTWVCFDTPHVHSVSPDFLKRLGYERVPLSAYSPDINSPIEHTFGRLKPTLHGRIYQACMEQRESELPLRKVHEVIESALADVSSAAVIARDVDRLVDVLQIIAGEEGQEFVTARGSAVEGTAGNWPPRGWR